MDDTCPFFDFDVALTLEHLSGIIVATKCDRDSLLKYVYRIDVTHKKGSTIEPLGQIRYAILTQERISGSQQRGIIAPHYNHEYLAKEDPKPFALRITRQSPVHSVRPHIC